ncbi:S-layer homology domain-containing protein [Pseudobacteroides cellulosolvens]|uniref:S-layer domain-containing protein n=1 Tax=Pseudobacteroides cellulosolvens ATCC 35603 = DSM 2933 TaxID=398512 RepID=A0A0L6JM52_9FIRM|nr:S-layer homology domain-containing protein [Pseudobacteroides cellulosolvens]KNY26482.1 S-layer domain-containing protein [Pseudobacteroides cellulosolvens ATCC 35603 = DSM 2933]
MKRTIAVFLMIFVVMTTLHTFGESNQPLCYNIFIDSSNQRNPVIYVMTTNADSRNSITADLVLNDGQTKVFGVERTMNITGSQTVFSLQIPESVTAGEYYIRFSSTSLQMTAQSLIKYLLTADAGNIPNVSVTPSSHEEGRSRDILIYIKMDVSDYTGVTAVFLNGQGKQAVDVNKGIGSFKNGNANIRLDVPEDVVSGKYKIRVQVLNKLKDMDYTITPSIISAEVPEITSLGVSKAYLVEGRISGNIIVNGKNFSAVSSRNTIEILNQMGSRVGTAFIPDMSSGETISFPVPSSLTAGSYTVRITTEGKSAASTSTFTVRKDDGISAPTPTVSNTEPLIKSVSLSSEAVNIEGKISGSIIVTCSGFLTKPVDNRLHIIDSSGAESVFAQLDPSSSGQRLTAPIPLNLKAGRYRIKFIINSKEYIGNSTFDILKDDNLPTDNAFSITGIDMSGCILYEGMVGGNAVIHGSGFNAIPSLLELINSSGELDGNKATMVSYTQNIILLRLPASIKRGVYRFKVTISGHSVMSRDSFEVAASPMVTPLPAQGDDFSGIVRKEENTPPPIEIKIDNIQTTIDKENNKSVTEVNGHQIISKLGVNSGRKAEIVLEIKDSDETAKEVLFNTEAISIIVGNNLDIKLSSRDVNINVPLDIFKQNSSSVLRVVIDQVSDTKFVETIPPSSIKGLNLRTPVIDLKVYKENGPITKIISNFTKNIGLQFPINITDETYDIRKYGIYYFNEIDKHWEYLGGRYNKEKGIFEGETNHFTKFAVIEPNISFSDVNEKHWARDYIDVLAAKQIVKGMGNNIFLPEGKVKRSEFATMVVKAFGIPLGTYQGKFIDVKSKDWFCLYVEALEKYGVIKGTGNGYFSPNSEITNQEIAVMLINAYSYMGKKPQKTSAAPFKDMGKVAHWAKDQVDLCYSIGIIEGKKGDLFDPIKKASRADTCKGVYNLVKALNRF